MNFYDPWIVDLRRNNNLNEIVSRVGLPPMPNYKMSHYRCFTIQLALLMCLVFGAISFMYSHYSVVTLVRSGNHIPDRYFGAPPNYARPKRKGLIIATNHRSGSTFLGQYFNQRSDSFYIFEPLVTFEGERGSANDEYLKIKHLRDLLYCNIRDQHLIFEEVGKSPNSESIKGVGQKCIPNNFCFREKSKALCSEEFCVSGNNVTCRQCGKIDSKMASLKCLSADITVIKVIRLNLIEDLRPLLEDPNLDLKIIHLTRDPRGILSSRSSLEGDAVRSVKRTCDKMSENLNGISQLHWLKGNYKILRYEDLCRYPMKLAKDIYNFVGLNMTSSMKRWIASNTNGQIGDLGDGRGYALISKMYKANKKEIHRKRIQHRRKREDISKDFPFTAKELKSALLNDRYTTTRNSSAVWREWTDKLDFTQVASVQGHCEDSMRTLGYRPVTDKLQLIDSFDILDKFCSKSAFALCDTTY